MGWAWHRSSPSESSPSPRQLKCVDGVLFKQAPQTSEPVMSEEKGKRDYWQKSVCICFKEVPL